MFKNTILPVLGLTTLLFGNPLLASTAQIQVEYTNHAPVGGTFQTPVWVGFHDGSFDTFTTGQAASEGLERIAEDGNPAQLSNEFGSANGRVDGVVGSAPIGPSGTVGNTFTLNTTGENHYFSYASMLLTSSDFFIGNGNPTAYDLSALLSGAVSSVSFDVFNVYDAGTEVNDFHTAAASTLFGSSVGQSMADQGADENGTVELVGSAGSEIPASFDAFNAFILFANAGDLSEQQLLNLNFTGYDRIGSFTLTNVSEVPVPAAAFLFSPFLLGFMGMRRKVKHA